jgi:hypothetical protein
MIVTASLLANNAVSLSHVVKREARNGAGYRNGMTEESMRASGPVGLVSNAGDSAREVSEHNREQETQNDGGRLLQDRLSSARAANYRGTSSITDIEELALR